MFDDAPEYQADLTGQWAGTDGSFFFVIVDDIDEESQHGFDSFAAHTLLGTPATLRIAFDMVKAAELMAEHVLDNKGEFDTDLEARNMSALLKHAAAIIDKAIEAPIPPLPTRRP